MSSDTLFSIVTPCLDDLAMLKRNCASVQRQAGVSLEHLIQDGGSRDGTAEWLAARGDLDSRIEADRGMYDALNRGLQRSRGDILAWLNADEQCLPNALRTVRDAFQAWPEVDILFGDYIVTDEQGCALAARREIPFRRWTIVNGVLYVQSCALYFRRRAWEQCGPFDTSYRICGDKEWLLRAAGKNLRFRHIPEFLGLYTLTARNLSRSPQIRAESERVRRAFGASRRRVVRQFARAWRVLEKALRGHYIERTVHYSFCDGDGAPHARTCRRGSRWSQARPHRAPP